LGKEIELFHAKGALLEAGVVFPPFVMLSAYFDMVRQAHHRCSVQVAQSPMLNHRIPMNSKDNPNEINEVFYDCVNVNFSISEGLRAEPRSRH